MVKEFDPTYNSEKHLYALKTDLNALSGNVFTTVNNFIETNTFEYNRVEYNLKQIFFAFKDTFEAEFSNFKNLMRQECEDLKSNYDYNYVEYKLKQIFNEFKVRIEGEFLNFREAVTQRVTNLFNNHDEYREELHNELEEHQNSINQQFEDFRQYLLNQFTDFKFGTGIVERIEAIEANLNTINQYIENVENNLNQYIENVENNLNNLNDSINQRISNLENSSNQQIEEQATYNEEAFLKKTEFEGDGVVLINNGTFTKLEKPEVPSVLTFDGNEFKWQPYKEYEI